MSEAGKSIAVKAPMQAVVHSVTVAVGDTVQAGQEVAVLEAMKMQHGLVSPAAGQVTAVEVCRRRGGRRRPACRFCRGWSGGGSSTD